MTPFQQSQGERKALALKLRADGKTFDQIGQVLLVTDSGAKMVYDRAVAERARDRSTIAGLSCRTFKCLRSIGVPESADRAAVLAILPRLRKGASSGKSSIKFFGRLSLQEIERWLAEKGGFGR